MAGGRTPKRGDEHDIGHYVTRRDRAPAGSARRRRDRARLGDPERRAVAGPEEPGDLHRAARAGQEGRARAPARATPWSAPPSWCSWTAPPAAPTRPSSRCPRAGCCPGSTCPVSSPPSCSTSSSSARRRSRPTPAGRRPCAGAASTDVSLVMVDPWSAGVYGNEPRTRAAGSCGRCRWVRSEPTTTATPGRSQLVAVVDLNTMEVVRVEDYGVVPLPPRGRQLVAEYVPDVRARISSRWRSSSPRARASSCDGHEVRWQKWRLRIGFTPREGLVLHTVTYRDQGRERPVLYRASVAEMVVPYGDPRPSTSTARTPSTWASTASARWPTR